VACDWDGLNEGWLRNFPKVFAEGRRKVERPRLSWLEDTENNLLEMKIMR
jgi:hypothetical protein